MKKKIIGSKLEKVLIFILGVIFASGLNVLADACTTTLSSTEITYGSTDVKSALDELYAVNTGTAGASQVLTGYTFSNDSDIGLAGTMANNGAVSESVGVGGSYTIPASVTCICEHAFALCKSLVSIRIPDSVTMIGKDAFFKCGGLISINIPKSVAIIGYGAFRKCGALKFIALRF